MPIPKKTNIMKENVTTTESDTNMTTVSDLNIPAGITDEEFDLTELDLLGEEDSLVSTVEPTKEPENISVAKEEIVPTTNNQPAQESIETQPKKEEKPMPIRYSRRAHRDGYCFKELSPEEQEMTRYLYTSEDELSNFFFVNKRAEEMAAFPDNKFYFNYSYGIPVEGGYFGYIIDCKRSVKKPNSYILKILVSETDVRCFVFTPGIFDLVSIAMKRDFNKKNNVFHSNAYEDIINCIIHFRVENTTSQTGVEYSNFIAFDFINNHEFSVLKKMISIMFNQSQK